MNDNLIVYDQCSDQLNTLQTVTFLNLYSCGLSDVATISLIKSLTVCLLANNYITDLTPVLGCVNLTKLDASTNKVFSDV